MVRRLQWRSFAVKILILSQLLVVVQPLHAEESQDGKDGKVRIVTEDPIVDGLFRKRLEAFTKEEQEPEDIAFLVFALVAGGGAFGSIKYIFSSAPFKAMESRKEFQRQLREKLQEKALWEKHDHDAVEKFVAARNAVESLRERLKTAPVSEQKELQKQLREQQITLSQLGGALEQSPSDCVKLLYYIHKLEIVDEKLQDVFTRMEDAAKKINKPHGAELSKAIKEWQKGRGLYGVEQWLHHADSQAILNNASMKAVMEDFTVAQKAASDLVEKTLPFYNAMAQKRNARIWEKQGKWRNHFLVRHIPLVGQKPVKLPDELPLYNYRVTETGLDTRNFDQTDAHHQPTGQVASRSRLVEAGKEQCALGYAQMLEDVQTLTWKSSKRYTFRAHEAMVGTAGGGLLGLWATNVYSEWTKGKGVVQSRSEGISFGKRVDNVSNDISAQMTADDAPAGAHRLAPLYDGTSNAIHAKMKHLVSQMEKNIAGLGGTEATEKLAALEKLKPFLDNKETIRNAVALSTFQVVSDQKFGDVQRFMDIIRTKQEGTLVTSTSEQVNLVVDASIRKFFASVSRDALMLLDNDGSIDKIRAEVLEHLRQANRDAPTSADSVLPISPPPGVKAEVVPQTKNSSATTGVPQEHKDATKLNTKDQAADAIPVAPPAAGLQASIYAGQGFATMPTALMDPMMDPSSSLPNP